MNISVNKKKYSIPTYSELTVNQFCNMMTAKVSNIPEYFSLFTDIPLETLMNAEYKSASNTYLFSSIFDVDITKTIRQKKDTLTFREETILLKELQFKTFGKAYLFDIYHQKHREEAISHLELFVYSLAIALSDHPSLGDVEDIKKELDKMQWIKVMPQAFFLAKKFLNRQKRFLNPSMLYTLGFIEIDMRIRHYLKRLQRLETTST